MFDQEDFVLDRRNIIYFNLYVIICSAEVHDFLHLIGRERERATALTGGHYFYSLVNNRIVES
jgi:hypothetical protein